jgi:hypothetical protein
MSNPWAKPSDGAKPATGGPPPWMKNKVQPPGGVQPGGGVPPLGLANKPQAPQPAVQAGNTGGGNVPPWMKAK